MNAGRMQSRLGFMCVAPSVSGNVDELFNVIEYKLIYEEAKIKLAFLVKFARARTRTHTHTKKAVHINNAPKIMTSCSHNHM